MQSHSASVDTKIIGFEMLVCELLICHVASCKLFSVWQKAAVAKWEGTFSDTVCQRCKLWHRRGTMSGCIHLALFQSLWSGLSCFYWPALLGCLAVSRKPCSNVAIYWSNHPVCGLAWKNSWYLASDTLQFKLVPKLKPPSHIIFKYL